MHALIGLQLEVFRDLAKGKIRQRRQWQKGAEDEQEEDASRHLAVQRARFYAKGWQIHGYGPSTLGMLISSRLGRIAMHTKTIYTPEVRLTRQAWAGIATYSPGGGGLQYR